MNMNKENPELGWAAWIIRLAMVLLFAVAAIGKWKMGIEATATGISGSFEGSWLPMVLVKPYAYSITFIETILAVWLLVGFKLRWAWVASGLVLVSLGFGMLVVGQHAVVANIYLYVMMACLGLYLSKYDCCRSGGCCKKC